jgi:predicted nucleic acid-binding protein
LRVAIDSNVISAVWSAEPVASLAVSQLYAARQRGKLLMCAPVYAELLAYPKASEPFLEQFLRETGIVVDFEISEVIWREAGRRFSRYAGRRRRSSGTHPRRLLVDFLVATHALLEADRLFTLDQDRYARDFPELQLF